MKRLFGSESVISDAASSFFMPLKLTLVFLYDALWTILKKPWGCRWSMYLENVDLLKACRVEGDSRAKPARSNISLKWKLSFSWKLMAVLEPQGPRPVRFGFIDPGGGVHLCSKRVRRHKYVAMTLGPDACTFFAVTENGEQVPVRQVNRASRYWLPRKTMVL